jgi:hypothetical protein
MSGSSVGSSREVNSLVSFVATENMQKKLEEFDRTREEPDVEVTVDKSHDNQRDFTAGSSGVSRSIHQLCVIITEAGEENDHADNGEVDKQVDKPRSNGKKEKEKITSPPGSGESLCQPSIMARKYPPFKKRSSDGVSIRTAPTQKEVEGGKRQVYEKSRKQQRIKWSILG